MTEKTKTYCLINYGCQMNESDTEHYAGQLEEMGYAPVDDFHIADVILVNTCCVRESAEKKIAGKIGELKAVKTKNSDVVICVAGCMAQKDGEKLIKKHPQVDLLLGTAYVNDFKQVLQDYLADRKGGAYTDLTIHQSEFEGRMVRQSPFAAWIPIMYGCNNFCTYCIVPYVRGRERSRSVENIVAEIEAAVRDGYKEFTLLGQNVNSYGKDWGETDAFARLLRRVDKIPGVERIHYMTSHPRDMSEEVVKAVAECEHICENFHVPFQAGSSEILRRMNRGYSKEKYLALIDLIRRYVPDAAITTDIIVGFPGETEEDFEETLDVVRRVGFASAFTFIYSKRSGTPAAKMENQVPLPVKKERLNRLMALQNENSLRYHQQLVGKTVEVLAEGPSRQADVWAGRTRTGVLVLWPVEDKKYEAGQKVRVLLDAAQTWLVKGKAVD
ncbi:MAG: tRNA (N6-isopentenyl adenosine(37)-C2)-methylthiotransferase MiaB [Phascolarctobacterium sp.]|uniref:tRNA (N6-isopentenyl adenosine(37)-C2)-methylthiotransferase MiaB n=1 Tax=Phascolarctobacterium sp. TaxID=2049039 RepID=UPI0026DBC654|nr:tRNA (N6-isopentenyl adenosine(37)-C2)-methylthiotransferase MiaB [Phascolarctobacterium sp.]MDO4921364.1 tRNA (N6-isopentenyl adenosine(37)-C2)-methylthiotransferase MiaB [Phascolarctobacterium sp.]